MKGMGAQSGQVTILGLELIDSVLDGFVFAHLKVGHVLLDYLVERRLSFCRVTNFYKTNRTVYGSCSCLSLGSELIHSKKKAIEIDTPNF
ncbi:hypothetical protein BpHYR1_045186 [Brachionus plicatilis]|uniref:Uncharacterized protein n=1 Tax=Brachionus plicatilis TaxID=10195 RepID=A0A3M7SCY9_BRAPC|nr:hypothetical protein BpHYR1_045186 [Brachionus plicatilis]